MKPSDWSILVLSRHAPQAASSRLRTFQYIPYLEAQGASVTVAPFFDEAYLSGFYRSGGRRPFDVMRAYARRAAALAKMRRASVVWIEKELFPFLPGFVESLPACLGVPYVVDYDDATFHSYDNSANPLVRHVLANKLDPLLRGARAVTVGNAYLETYARAHGAKSIVRIPTVIDLARYIPRAEPTADEIRVGWIGTPATMKYLELLRAPLQDISKTYKIRLVTIGAGPLVDFGVPLEQHAWSADTETALLSTLHIGVMPLPDAPWERGKCGYKLIQYMAAARPVIASPVGMNADIVTADVGILAGDQAAWSAALTWLAGNAELRCRMGIAARARVETFFSLQVMSPTIGALLSNIAFG
jgi:glycosyltransferase involved in cell wall biosynthesis